MPALPVPALPPYPEKMKGNAVVVSLIALLMVSSANLLHAEPTETELDGYTEPRTRTDLEEDLEEFLLTIYRDEYFRTHEIAGESMELRMPFGMNFERDAFDWTHIVYGGGRSRPEELWDYIRDVLESDAFERYVQELSVPGPKVVHFNMPEGSWVVMTGEKLIDSMRETRYPSSVLAFIYYLKEDDRINAVDVYNYLYAVARVGIDCVGLIYNMTRDLAERFGLDLDEHVMESDPGIEDRADEPEDVPIYTGLSFFDPTGPHVEEVDDLVINLRPGDLLLFKGYGDEFIHSAIIQSVDFRKGRITYYQATDWAPLEQRGVHESTIEFDPTEPAVSLSDEDLHWDKQVQPAFPGEAGPRYLQTDADRYRESDVHSGGTVVRLRTLRDLIEEREPQYYETRQDR